jgi:uncharacterized YigZ family protein
MTPNPSDEYLTIKEKVRFKTKVQGSVFIATAVPVDSLPSAEKWIGKISAEFFDATHNCFAVRIRQTGEDASKFSDAGEPRGTAGKPILSAIESENLHNVLVVVTRYFGGTKLGTGGLARAYKQAAQGALQSAERTRELVQAEIHLIYPLNMTGRVNQVLAKLGATVTDRGFQEGALACILVRKGLLGQLKKALTDATNGQIRFE